MNDSPFTTHGDEPVEARIVSWVLGEASAFEAAELERLCEERPELMVFKRRMLALHGLLIESETGRSDDDKWKLPPEKRKTVDVLFGEQNPIRLEVEKEKRIRHSGRRVLLAIAACVILTIAIVGLIAPASIQKAHRISDVRHMEKRGSQEQEVARRVQPLRTEFPPELIEGTPKPMNVPNLEGPVSGPAGSTTWRNEESQLAQNEKRRGQVFPATNSPPMPPGATGSRSVIAVQDSSNDVLPESAVAFGEMNGASDDLRAEDEKPVGGELALRQLRPRIDPKPSQPVAEVAPASNADPFADEGGATSRLAERQSVTKSGSAFLSYNSGGVMPADEQVTGGNRSGSGSIEKGNIAALLEKDAESLGEKAGSAGKEMAQTSDAPADMQTLGKLFSQEDKSDHASGFDYADRTGTLSGTNTYSGGTAVTGGALGIGGSGGGGFARTAPEAQPAASGEVVGDASVSLNEELNQEGQKKDEGKLVGGIEIVGGSKFELKPGNASEYNFRGAALGKGKAMIPDDAEALEKAVRDQEDKVEERRKVLATIVRNKGVIYKGGELSKDEARGEAIKRGLDAQDYVDAKSQYETDAGLLERMKLKLGEGLDADSLAKAVRDQEDKVEERRKVLATIVRNKGVIYKGQDSFYRESGVDEDEGARNAQQTYQDIEQEQMQLESQVSSLLKYNSDDLMVYAGGLNLPNNIIRELYPKYQEAKRQLDGLKIKGLGDQHPTVQTTMDQVQNMKRQLDEGVVTLRATLQAQLELSRNRLKSWEIAKNDSREEAIKRGLDAADYVDAKKEFENDEMLLHQMKLKLMAASKKAKPEPPKVDLAKLMEEIPASEDPYSTFSLNISDVSFQVAQAALAKGERPDPAGIKVEQFYNAVDYGDPAPSANEPVAVNIEQSAHPVIPGRNLVRVALKTAAAGRSAAQPLCLTLLVDQSGSMVREDRRAAMDKALAGLSELLTQNDLVTVIGFSRTPRLLVDGMAGDKAGKLADLVNQAASEGGTNLEEAIKLADQMAGRKKLAGAQNRIVLFTDGAANLGNADPARLAEHVKQLRQKGIAFDIAGIAADGLNDELLGELARNGNGRYYVVGKGGDDNFAKQLAGAFRPAAENVKVQVRFNPERVGRYKLIGFEKDRLKTEDFRNDTVDAAELAAEEAGVAIYQVETLPEGNGELGEVSVRFRDAARGEMVERAWTISHDAAVPAIDRARPSMQLAVLAMLAGEKLKGGPLADAIDFKQLADSMAEVKHYYGGDGRVGGMLRVVELLK